MTTLAGSAGTYTHADGVGTAASFSYPLGIVVDAQGTLYVTEASDPSDRKVTQDGVVTTMALPSGISANAVTGIALDAHGSFYLVQTNTIVKVSPTGVARTLAGSGASGTADGAGTSPSFAWPWGLAVDADFNVYVSDNTTEIRKITQ